ncbi:MAG: hypothetical protein ACSW72_04145, partial [Bacteroidales bacterium]
MRKVFLLLAAWFLAGAFPVFGQTAGLPVSSKLFSISSEPGADASVSVGINWACDTSFKHTCVRLTEVSDTDWTAARDIKPSQHERYTA